MEKDKNRCILIACAMKVEASVFLDKLNIINERKIGNFSFYESSCNDYSIVILVSNPGLINMASAISFGINLYNPCIILNYGVVGAFCDNIHQGDIIIGDECINIGSYLSGVMDKNMGVDINNWNLMSFTDGDVDDLVVFNADSHLLMLINSKKNDYQFGRVWNGRIGSSDVWDREYDKLMMLKNKYNVICEDMECVSVYQIAFNFSIPVISIKVVSDNIILNEKYDKEVLLKSYDFIFDFLFFLCSENYLKRTEKNT